MLAVGALLFLRHRLLTEMVAILDFRLISYFAFEHILDHFGPNWTISIEDENFTHFGQKLEAYFGKPICLEGF